MAADVPRHPALAQPGKMGLTARLSLSRAIGFVLCSAVLFGPGCLGPKRRPSAKAPVQPAAVVKDVLLDAPLKVSWTETIRRLERKGFPVESAVPQKGLIFTKWKVAQNVRSQYGVRPRRGPAPMAERVRADLSLKSKPGGKTYVRVSATVQQLYRIRRRRGDHKPPAVWKTTRSNGTLETLLVEIVR